MKTLIFKQLEVRIDAERQALTATYTPPDGEGILLMEATFALRNADGTPLPFDALSHVQTETQEDIDGVCWSCTMDDGAPASRHASFSIILGNRKLRLSFGGGCRLVLQGHLFPEIPYDELLSVNTGRASSTLCASSGPATAPGDNALFDRQRDLLLDYSCTGTFSTSFDWGRMRYGFSCESDGKAVSELDFGVTEDACKTRFNLPYRGIRKRKGFETPSVGWMTWYAVKFDASEAVVLENAAAFMRHFGGHLAARPVLWVDWEWCHRDLTGLGVDGCTMFQPRKDVYPNGLEAVAEKLKAMGFLPALWVGPTNDGRPNAIMEEHPEWILCQAARWCGQYWFDLSNPKVRDTVIPRLFRQVMAWGYEAIKWDCIPLTIKMLADYADKRFDPRTSPAQIFRDTARTARAAIGDDVYMMSCCGYQEMDIEWGMDFFDGARIGGDIFTWEEFLKEGIGRILRFYPLHNTALYIDADNLILREQFSSVAQARTRVSVYGLAGLPVTIGDAFRDLDEPRLAMLKTIMPVIDIRPGELEPKAIDGDFQLIRLNVARRFGQWMVAAVSNLTDKDHDRRLRLKEELNLPKGEYAVYDFWNRRFMGVFTETIPLSVPAFDTVVLRLVAVTNDVPAVISVSRHITQGGYELEALAVSAEEIGGTVRVAAGEPCTVTLLLPEGRTIQTATAPVELEGRVAVLRLLSSQQESVKWHCRLK